MKRTRSLRRDGGGTRGVRQRSAARPQCRRRAVHRRRRRAARHRGRRARRPRRSASRRARTSRRSGGRCSARRALDALVRQALDEQPDAGAGAGPAAPGAGRPERAQRRAGCRSVDAKLSANRIDVDPQVARRAGLPVAMPLNLYLASVSVSYTFDLSAAARRELEALRAEVDHQHYELEAARLMLAGNVVTAAIREASLREQIAHSEEIVALQARQLAIAERLRAARRRRTTDVVAQRRDLAQAARRAARAAARSSNSCATGSRCTSASRPARRAAARVPPGRAATAGRAAAQPAVAAGAPAARHPRRRGAAAAGRRAVGVATANLYPQITLSATARLARLEQRRRPVRQRQRLLPARRVADAADLPRRRAAGQAPLGGRGLRAGRRGLPGGGAAGLSERGRRAARARGRCR